MLRKALERAGHSVDEAADGSTAVNKIRSRRYLLVLSDLKLPGCSGLEVLHQSKQADPTIPVILITAYPNEKHRTRALDNGAVGFLSKPFDEESLIKCLIAAITTPARAVKGLITLGTRAIK